MHDINDMSILSQIWRFHSLRNTTYLERRNPECIILGRESYWSLDNQHVIYWSSQAVLTRSRWVGICCGLMEVCEPEGWLLLIWSWESVPREMHGIGHSESQSRYWYCLFVWLDVQYISTMLLCQKQPTNLKQFSVFGNESWQERRWKGCRAVDVQRISTKASPGCIGAPERMHLLSPSLQRGWFEWNGKNWEKLLACTSVGKDCHTLHWIYVGNYLYDRCIYIYTYIFLNVHIDDLIIEVVGLFADKVDRCWGSVKIIANRFKGCELSQVHLHTATCPRIPISGVTSFGPVTAPLRIVALKGFWYLDVRSKFLPSMGTILLIDIVFQYIDLHVNSCLQVALTLRRAAVNTSYVERRHLAA